MINFENITMQEMEEVEPVEQFYRDVEEEIHFQLDDDQVCFSTVRNVDPSDIRSGMTAHEEFYGELSWTLEAVLPAMPRHGYFVSEVDSIHYSYDSYHREGDVNLYLGDIRPMTLREIVDFNGSRLTWQQFWDQLKAAWILSRNIR